MPRRKRCLLPGVPCRVTQRGVERRVTFSVDDDRRTYLQLLRENLEKTAVRLLAWCLMGNHLHLVAVPERDDALSVLMRRVHGRYAQYYNARWGRTGHLWQNRFFACMLGPQHLWRALAYVDRNPVRAGLVQLAGHYRWSSARAHVTGEDEDALLDMAWWKREAPDNRAARLEAEDAETLAALRNCTYAGRPFADEKLVTEWGERFGRKWNRGRPRKERQPKTQQVASTDQLDLF